MIAGIILSLITYLILSVPGTAIGMSALAPLARPNPLQGFAFSSGAYLIVMTVIAVFVGSWFAGRCAPVPGWLHGLLAWAVMVLLLVYGAASLLGGTVSGAATMAADAAARDVARAAWFSFAALLVGAIISIVSGHAGFRHQPPFEEGTGPSAEDIALRRDATREALPGRTFP